MALYLPNISAPPRARTPNIVSPSRLSRPLHLLPPESMYRSSSVPARGSSPLASSGRDAIRARLVKYSTFDDAVTLLEKSNNIVVLTGAGISTSLGIPDFRSKGAGLYSRLQLQGSPFDDPQDLFNINTYKFETESFLKYAKPIIPDYVPGTKPIKGLSDVEVPQYSPTHAFLTVLQSQKKLLTNYTQNIDGLEKAAGICNDNLVQCHGTWETATCLTCGKQISAKKYLPVIRNQDIPLCKCSMSKPTKKPVKSGQRKKKKRKRHEFEDSDHSSDNGNTVRRGLLKPDITFFDEKIPRTYGSRLEEDKGRVDLLLIIGTTCQVAPVKDMLTDVPPNIPQIWISKERCKVDGVKVDIELLGECDVIIEELCRRAGWSNVLEKKLWRPMSSASAESASEPSTTDKTVGISSEKESSSPPADEVRGVDKQEDPKSLPIHSKRDSNTYSSKSSSQSKRSSEEASAAAVAIELEEGTHWRWYVRRK